MTVIFHILGMSSSSQLTFTPSFFRGVGIPTSNQRILKKSCHICCQTFLSPGAWRSHGRQGQDAHRLRWGRGPGKWLRCWAELGRFWWISWWFRISWGFHGDVMGCDGIWWWFYGDFMGFDEVMMGLSGISWRFSRTIDVDLMRLWWGWIRI